MEKIKHYWTCCDYVHHEHSTYLGAWFCASLQYMLFQFLKAVRLNPLWLYEAFSWIPITKNSRAKIVRFH